jgi:exodeoxyribonuclease V alpha subunit
VTATADAARGTTDARLALRTTGRLRELNEVGVLRAADVHVAQRLGALAGETDPDVLVALALAVRGARNGSVVLRLADVAGTVLADETEDGSSPSQPLEWPDPDGWLAAVRRSPLVGGALQVEGDLVWLTRYWRQEREVADDLLARAASVPDVDLNRLRDALARLWPGTLHDDQRRAAAVCALSRVSVLGGGPGTGKTTTVARLLAALREAAPGGAPRTALAAPTGRAAARLHEAVQGAAGLTSGDHEFLDGLPASTLHRLLGLRRGARGPWHHAGNRLPHDLVVVDEASMVSLTLMAALLAALRPSARLVLVGDPDQLASVEAGAVLADLVGPAPRPLPSPAMAGRLRSVLPHDDVQPGPAGAASALSDGVVLLTRTHRFGGEIGALAGAIRARDADAALEVLRAGAASVAFDEVPDDGPVGGSVLDDLRVELVTAARPVIAAARAGDAAAALEAVGHHRLLCAHRQGPRGVAHWAGLVRRWVVEDVGVTPRRDGTYPGLALLVTANDPENRLWNGDVGVVVDRDGELVVAFGSLPDCVPLGRLGDVQQLHASTVHRAQGSQASRVTVVLPPSTSPLGTRETLYTAVTRAQDRVRVVGSEAAVRAAVERGVARATGLARRLAREPS